MMIQFPLLFRVLGNGFRAMALYPLIVVRDKTECTTELLQHEQIHLRQQLELLVIPFYLIYVLEYMWHLIILQDRKRAYHSISFEKEAYRFDREKGYLQNRKAYAMWRSDRSRR